MTTLTARLSFSALDAKEQNLINAFFDQTRPSRIDQRLKERFEEIKFKPWRQGRPRSAVMGYQTKSLLQLNPLTFKFISEEEKAVLLEDLKLTFFNLCIRYRYSLIEEQYQDLRNQYIEIERCNLLINQLLLLKKNPQYPVTHAQWLDKKAKLLLELESPLYSSSQLMLDTINLGNTWRLYWVWAGVMMRTLLSLPALTNFYNAQQTLEVASLPQNQMGYASFILYYLRFSIHMILTLKHTLKRFWMNEEEKEMVSQQGSWNRFYEQIMARKFVLINDLLWATNNALCFLKFVSGTPLGPYGDLFTTILLVADFKLANLALTEALEAHQQEIKLFDDEIALLKTKQKQFPDDKKLDIQIAQLNKAKARCEKDWESNAAPYKGQQATMIYSGATIFAFILLVMPWKNLFTNLGISPQAASMATTMLGATGASLLFLFSVIHTAYQAYLEVSRAQDERNKTVLLCDEILTIINQGGGPDDLNTIRYNDLKQQALQQQAMVDYQFYSFIRITLLQSLMPIMMFAAFTFSTFGIGMAVMASGLVLALASHYLIENQRPSELEPSGKVIPLDLKQERIDIDEAKKNAQQRSIRLFSASEHQPGENAKPPAPK